MTNEYTVNVDKRTYHFTVEHITILPKIILIFPKNYHTKLQKLNMIIVFNVRKNWIIKYILY